MINPDWPLLRGPTTPAYIIGVLQYTASRPDLQKLFRILGSAFKMLRDRNCYWEYAGLMPDGTVRSAAWDKYGTLDTRHIVGTLDELRTMLYKVCNDLRLEDEEAQDLFNQVKRWIAYDYSDEEGEFTLRKMLEFKRVLENNATA